MTAKTKAQWLDLGIACGFGAAVAYPLAVFVPLPALASYLVFSAFGPLLIVACVGLYVFLREQRDTVSLQLATLFLVCAGVMVTAMATMQGSIIFQIREFAAEADPSAREMWRSIFRATMSTQLGLDFGWDIFISVGTLLLAWNVAAHPRFWRGFGWAGMLIAAAGLTLNAITFPENSGVAGLVDPGPFFGAWFGLLVLALLRNRRWFRERLAEGSRPA